MPNIRLDIAYDGSGFRGYAIQDGVRTVQGELEAALGTYLRSPVETAVAGRTDAGVHARGQVVSFVHDGDVDLRRLPRAIAGIVGPEISVRQAAVVADDFNARFSATWRRYRYSMGTGSHRDPLTRGFVWHVGRRLDSTSMTVAAKAFIGQHDFSAFCRSVEGKSNVRRLTELSVTQNGEVFEFWVQSNAFCHQMVRSIVGYLYDIGRGYSDVQLVEEVISAGDRSSVGTVAPAHGLTLWAVGYDS